MPWQPLAVLGLPLALWWVLRGLGFTQAADQRTTWEMSSVVLLVLGTQLASSLFGLLRSRSQSLAAGAILACTMAICIIISARGLLRRRAKGSPLFNVLWCASLGLVVFAFVVLHRHVLAGR